MSLDSRPWLAALIAFCVAGIVTWLIFGQLDGPIIVVVPIAAAVAVAVYTLTLKAFR